MRTIRTPAAPLPAGHYAQAVVHGGLVYVSGQLPIDPTTGPGEPGEIEDQTRRVLANLEAVLIAAGTTPSRVLRATVYVSDVGLWGRVNAVYAEFFSRHGGLPARSVVPTGPLHYGYQVEVDAVAALPEGAGETP
ncbi:MAG: RidA family protein [Phycisphaeraceae bacterium]|nr:MAG: RidA family protein [Phycisphaeraceae bacterium]